MPESPSTTEQAAEPVVRAQSAKPVLDPAGSRIGLIVAGLIVALVVGFTLGKLLGPPSSPTEGATTGAPAPTGSAAPGAHVHSPLASAGSEVGGLSISSGGYTLVPATTTFDKPGTRQLSFVIRAGDGSAATNFAVVHDKPLHLVVVRRDLTGYQHLHPVMAADGTWSVTADLDKPGLWRAYADFTAVDKAGIQTAVALGTDLTVAGDYAPKALPAAAQQTETGGYTVAYQGATMIGASQPMLFTVTRDGKPVTMQPYLGSFGHLVVLRDLDLGYVHVHPEPALVNGGVKFWLSAPSAGTYRMYFDFQADGKVHTAEFTLVVPAPGQ
ncbi:hypothetical protein Cs7R123_77620 [Catellatospora sp. TT07R-123]|uniref:hypothetical protein n=1 Tax=Catellatospora sp. TT07R-123 TaxID=2733863 RepID=UPI001B0A088F|nr:hypothetical protein [Catellatospora sp. TT07R-123]GHJ50420.1 hypothetical protein Cs7R123_77620 [Catellatospora sp. TT07R-123]